MGDLEGICTLVGAKRVDVFEEVMMTLMATTQIYDIIQLEGNFPHN
jgi:hypothetical protein